MSIAAAGRLPDVAPVRIAHVVNSLDVGGGERFLVDLCLNLPRDRFAPEVVCLFRPGSLAGVLEARGIAVRSLGLRGTGVRLDAYRTLARALRAGAFAVVHTHLQEGCWYGLPAAALAGIPVRVAHLQNVRPEGSPKLRLLDAAALRFAHAAIGFSAEVVEHHRRRLRYPASRLHLVHNVIDDRRFRPPPDRDAARAALGLAPAHVAVVNVASLTPQKGQAQLLVAARAVRERFPGVRFLLVGDGLERARLETLRRDLGLEEHVVLLGKRDDVPAILAASDVFVLPSRWEGLSVALLEAGLAGLPAVVSDLPANREVVQAGTTGLVVPVDQPDGLAAAVCTLIDDPELRRRLGRAAKRRVVERFLMDASVQKVTRIYDELLRERRPDAG